MKVENINNIPNQFVITETGGIMGNFNIRKTFRSYDSVIAIITEWDDSVDVELDSKFWDYSRTTGKYRNIFLGENKKETQKKIDSGEYTLTNLNK